MKLKTLIETIVNEHLEYIESKKKWALVSKTTGRVLRYYHGEGKPSQAWVSKMEQQIHAFESVNPNEFYTVQTMQGDTYSVYPNGNAENDYTGQKWSKIVFIPKEYADKVRSIDKMVKHFGIDNVGIKPENDNTFGFYKLSDGKEIQGLYKGKAEPFKFPYSPKAKKDSMTFAFNVDPNGKLINYHIGGLVGIVTGKRLGESHLPSNVLYDCKSRAKAERKAGGYIEIDNTLPTISIVMSDGSEYFFQGHEATDLLDEVPDNINSEDYILAMAQGW